MAEAKTAPLQSGVPKSVIDRLPVTVEAVLGVAQVSIGELGALKQGDCVTMEARLGDQVELRLNGVTIAGGELVSVGDNFAVRIQTIAKN